MKCVCMLQIIMEIHFSKEYNNFGLYIFGNDIFVENYYRLREKKMQKIGIYLEVFSLIGGILSAPSKTQVISLFSFSSIDKYSHMPKAKLLLCMLDLKFFTKFEGKSTFQQLLTFVPGVYPQDHSGVCLLILPQKSTSDT